MSKDDKPATTPAPAPAVPASLPEELLPVYDWYREKGQKLIYAALAVLIVVLAAFALMRHRASRADEASTALLSAEGVEGLENLNGQYGSTRLGPLIRIRLAKAYFAAGSYKEARTTYEDFLKSHSQHELADIAKIGLASTLEAERAFGEAEREFATFAQANPNHYLYPVAIMGQARCLAAEARKPEAFDLLDRLMVAKANTPWEAMAKDLRGVIERFEGFKSRSIFDQMEAAAKDLAVPSDTALNEGLLDIPVHATATGGVVETEAPNAN